MPFKDKAVAASYMKIWRAKNKSTERPSANKRLAAHRRRMAALIRAEKDKPCKDCVVAYPYYVMHFDHLGGKVISVSRTVRAGWSERKIREEIAKCDVVCANCHAERTHNRRVAKLDCNSFTPSQNGGSNPSAPTKSVGMFRL